ncbi:RecB family exonuclease [Candidatus Margulisiibacteriota bacterium]
MLSLSPSKIKTYLLCPFQYKCDCDTETRKRYFRDSPALTFGNLVHAALNDLYKRTPKEERSLDKLREIFKAKYMVHKKKHDKIFGSKEKVIEYVLKARKMFEYFCQSEFFDANPFSTEDYPRCKMSSDLEISGKFDRLDLVGDQLTIIDYKTGTIREDDSDPFQLDFYELLVQLVYPNYQVTRKVYYFLGDNKIIEFPVKANSISELREKVLNIAEHISSTVNFEANQNDKCRFCNYHEICPLREG